MSPAGSFFSHAVPLGHELHAPATSVHDCDDDRAARSTRYGGHAQPSALQLSSSSSGTIERIIKAEKIMGIASCVLRRCRGRRRPEAAALTLRAARTLAARLRQRCRRRRWRSSAGACARGRRRRGRRGRRRHADVRAQLWCTSRALAYQTIWLNV